MDTHLSATKFGKTEIEEHYEQMAVSRQIVQEILKFGVSQSQMVRVIYLLSLELEDGELLRKITELTSQKFLKDEDDEDSDKESVIIV